MRNIESVTVLKNTIVVTFHGRKINAQIINIFSEEGAQFLTSDEFQWAKFEKKVVVRR